MPSFFFETILQMEINCTFTDLLPPIEKPELSGWANFLFLKVQIMVTVHHPLRMLSCWPSLTFLGER